MADTKSRKQVIVVEDDKNDYTLISHALQESGEAFNLRRVDTAEELDEELLRLAPDLVLCDHAGATWDSFAVLERVRAFQPSTPFVVVSGLLDEHTQAELRSRGADGCVRKNELAELALVVEQVLRLRAEDQWKKVEEIRRSLPPLPIPGRPRARFALQACG